MSGFGGAVKLTGESEYKKALKEITRNLREVSSEMKVVTATFGKNDKSVQGLTAKQAALNLQLREQRSRLSNLESEYKLMSDRFVEQTQKHNALIATYTKEKSELERIGNTLGTTSKEYLEQEKVVEALEKQVNDSTKAQEYNEKSMSDMRIEINKAQADVNKTTNELGRMETQLNEAKDAENRLGSASGQLASKISDQENKVASLKEEYKNAVLQYGKNSSEAQKLATKIETLSGELAENKRQMKDADSAADALDKSLDEISESADKANGGFSVFKGTLANLVSQGIQKVSGAITGQMDAAISRVDTIHSFEKTMKALGFTEDEVAASMDKLKGGIEGLPTTLPQVVSMQQQYTALTGDVDKATALTLALNDATVASGKGQEEAARAAEHWYTMLASGKPELDNWKEANTIMPAQMKQLAQSILGTTATSQDLFKAWQSGEVSTEQIMDALINLDQKGGKGFQSFAKQAKDGSSGIETSMTNVKTAITNGLAQLIEEVGYDNIVKGFDSVKEAIKTIIPYVVDFAKKFINALKWLKDNGTVIQAVLTGLGVAIGGLIALEVITNMSKYVKLVKAWAAETKIVTAAQWLLNAAMSANPIGLIVVAVLALVAAFVVLWNKSETFREFWKGLWENVKEIAGVVIEAIKGFFTTAWDTIKNVWSVAVGVFQGIWDGIKAVFSTVVDFFTSIFSTAWNAIQTVWSVVVTFFQGIWDGIKAVFSTVIGFYKNAFTGAWNAITSVWNKAKGFFQGVWTNIRKIFASVATWFGARFKEAWNAIKRPFAAVGSFFGGIWSTIRSKFQDIGQRLGDTIGGAFKKAINAVLRTVENVINAPVRAINGLIGIINDLGFSFGYLNEIYLPRLSKGGVLKKGQVGLLEGDGAEAVVPLEQNTKWIRRVADEMRLSLANGQGNTLSNNTGSFNGDQITVNVYGSQGMDVNTLAIAVEQRLARVQRQKQEVWA